MAKDTSKSLRNSIIYEVYIRNHTAEGTFKSFIDDIDRIKSLGTDIIWFMPIHPIGEKNRKGSLGCPYSIKDYLEVNPEYGNIEDFKQVINEIHKKDMKVMIDVVYNHTSTDSKLFSEHPEYFFKNSNGEAGNRVGEWYDVLDLDYSNMNLWNSQIETLKYWAGIGVDGFRCDVASIVPVEFWKRARNELSKLKNITWLAESVHPDFIVEMRSKGYEAFSDSEVFEAFDITYDYDVIEEFYKYINEKIPLEEYLKALRRQESTYPDNYVKLKFLENHDQKRARMLIKNENKLLNWTAFCYFQKGCTLLYAGQETRNDNTPSLFEKDTVNWGRYDNEYVELLKKLGQIKKDSIFADGNYKIYSSADTNVIKASYENRERMLAGIFNVEERHGFINTEFTDGIYTNLLNGDKVVISDGKVGLSNEPIIIDIIK